MEDEIKVDAVLNSKDVEEFQLWFSLNSRIILNAFCVIAYFAVVLLIRKDYSTERISILAGTAVLLSVVLWFTMKRSLIKKSKKHSKVIN